MYKRIFKVNSLPPITLENLKYYDVIHYKTYYVDLIQVNNKFYLLKDEKKFCIKKEFFDLIKTSSIFKNEKRIYVIPLTANFNIYLNVYKDKSMDAVVYFNSLDEANNFIKPNFFKEEIENKVFKKNMN